MAGRDPLRQYLGVQQNADRELAQRLERAARDARAQIRRLPRGSVRRAQLERVLRQVKRAQALMWQQDVLGIVASGREEAVRAAQTAADDLTRELWRRVPERQAEALDRSFNASPAQSVGTVRQRRELSTRVVGSGRLAQRRIDAIVQSALTRQLSADELAREVYDHISPSVPGGASYAAMRLARTEINNAFHAEQIAQGQRPGVEAVEWNLSGSHKVPDECNVYAKKREFAPDAVPDKPHPQCLCYLTYKMASVDDFLEALESGAFDDVLGVAAPVKKAAPAKKAAPRKRAPAKKATPPKATPAKKAAPAKKAEPKPVVGMPAAARTDEWLDDNLAPEVAEAARTAYDACNERAPKRANFRIRTVSTYNRRTSPKHFHKTMDGGAYASCSGGHIVVQGSLVENRRKIRDAMDKGRFIRHRERQDELVYTLAHEMGHALTVGHLTQDEQDQLMSMIGDIMGWDPAELALYKGLDGDSVLTVMLADADARTAFEKKFGKYAGANMDEFIAEVWSVYVLDPEECDPDVKRLGELLVTFIENVPVLDEDTVAEMMARFERIAKEREEGK